MLLWVALTAPSWVRFPQTDSPLSFPPFVRPPSLSFVFITNQRVVEIK